MDVGVEMGWSLPKLKILFMSYLLSFGQMLLRYHFFELFSLGFLSLLQLLHCVLVSYFCFTPPSLLQLKQLLMRVIFILRKLIQQVSIRILLKQFLLTEQFLLFFHSKTYQI